MHGRRSYFGTTPRLFDLHTSDNNWRHVVLRHMETRCQNNLGTTKRKKDQRYLLSITNDSHSQYRLSRIYFGTLTRNARRQRNDPSLLHLEFYAGGYSVCFVWLFTRGLFGTVLHTPYLTMAIFTLPRHPKWRYSSPNNEIPISPLKI